MTAVEQATSRPVRISSIETAIVSTYLPGEFRVSHGADSRQRDHVLVRISDAEGVAGFGEASPLTFFTGETAESVRHAIDSYFVPLTLAQDATQIAALHRAWDRTYRGHGAAKCALDLALHDLIARRAGRPVADLLGGIANDWLPLYKAIGFGSPDYVVAEAEGLWEIGIRRFKLKIGEGTRHDLAKLNALRERFGLDAEIVLDGNGGYAPQEAVRMLRQAEPFGATYIEQPVPGDDLEGLAFVRAHGGVPVMADESLHTLRDAHRLICMGAADLFGIKLIKTGGLWPARQIAALAEACGVASVVISPFDTQLGIAAAAHLAATFPRPLQAQGLGTFLVASGEAERQLRVVDGQLAVPIAAGFGITPEAALFERG